MVKLQSTYNDKNKLNGQLTARYENINKKYVYTEISHLWALHATRHTTQKYTIHSEYNTYTIAHAIQKNVLKFWDIRLLMQFKLIQRHTFFPSDHVFHKTLFLQARCLKKSQKWNLRNYIFCSYDAGSQPRTDSLHSCIWIISIVNNKGILFNQTGICHIHLLVEIVTDAYL